MGVFNLPVMVKLSGACTMPIHPSAAVSIGFSSKGKALLCTPFGGPMKFCHQGEHHLFALTEH